MSKKNKNFIKTFCQFLYFFSKKIFSVKNIDNHLAVYILGVRIRKKLPPVKFDTSLNEFGLNKDARSPKIILSLTSFPERIETVSMHSFKTDNKA